MLRTSFSSWFAVSCKSYLSGCDPGRVKFIRDILKLTVESKPPELNSPNNRACAVVRWIWVPPMSGSVVLTGSLLRPRTSLRLTEWLLKAVRKLE